MTNQTAEERARRWFRARGIYEKGPACDSLAGEFRAAEQAAYDRGTANEKLMYERGFTDGGHAALEEAREDYLTRTDRMVVGWLRAQRAKGED